jgi:hypothetical protein
MHGRFKRLVPSMADFQRCGRCQGTLFGAMVPHPVQEYAVDHDIGFCEPINAVRSHLPPGLNLPAVTAPEQKAKNADTEKTAAAPPNDTDHLVAVLMARPEIKSRVARCRVSSSTTHLVQRFLRGRF